MKTYHVHHILVKARFEAEDLLKKIAEGKKFSELAKKFSTCNSAAHGGDLGELKMGQADCDFEEAALALPVGKTSSNPIRSKFGYHIIHRIK
ncbi:MAG: peptidyl-prolyl cis-trans isomerase [Bdellovibrionaceae bacterium]|nr:peptidyl-prolyl cis-trans isomerase [Bdellovibrio sp.]